MVPYPSEYESNRKLKDGTEILLRSIKPEDEPLWLEMFNNFSESSVWNRFFNIVKDNSFLSLTTRALCRRYVFDKEF